MNDNSFTNYSLVSQIVFQTTPFCNINCSYCYLPDRNDNSLISQDAVLKTLERVFESGKYNSEIEVRWHAGEPLTAPIDFYSDIIPLANRLCPYNVTLNHSLQTNATLISDDWCNLFLEHNIKIGVSIDGPKHIHDTYRCHRSGKGSFDSTMRGIDYLRKHNINYEVICVITDASLNHAKEIFKFFESLSPSLLGLNVEETEGINKSSLLSSINFTDQYKIFFNQFIKLQSNSELKIRERQHIEKTIIYGDEEIDNWMVKPLAIITVDVNGNLSTFSPELSTLISPVYGSFHIGNIHTHSLLEMINSTKFKSLYRDISLGVSYCKNTCEYFCICGGGSPSNKLLENDSFNSGSTGYCESRIKIPTDILIKVLEGKSEDDFITHCE